MRGASFRKFVKITQKKNFFDTRDDKFVSYPPNWQKGNRFITDQK